MRDGGNEWRAPSPTCLGRRYSVKLPVIHWGLRRKMPGGRIMPKPSQSGHRLRRAACRVRRARVADRRLTLSGASGSNVIISGSAAPRAGLKARTGRAQRLPLTSPGPRAAARSALAVRGPPCRRRPPCGPPRSIPRMWVAMGGAAGTGGLSSRVAAPLRERSPTTISPMKARHLPSR